VEVTQDGADCVLVGQGGRAEPEGPAYIVSKPDLVCRPDLQVRHHGGVRARRTGRQQAEQDERETEGNRGHGDLSGNAAIEDEDLAREVFALVGGEVADGGSGLTGPAAAFQR